MAGLQHLVIPYILLLAVKAFPVQEDTTENVTENITKCYKEEEINYRLPKSATPRHYNLEIIPHIVPGNFTFDGEVRIVLETHILTNKLAVHSKALMISYNDTFLISERKLDRIVPFEHSYNNETEILTIRFDEEITPGNYTLYFKFTGILNDDNLGFYRTSYTDDKNTTVWLAVTDFEPTAARMAFPCMDEPALKSTFDISIKHYPNYTALSNMPIYKQSEIDKTDGKIWTRFNTTPMMSTYVVAFLVSDFVKINNNDTTVNVWSRSNAISLTEFGYKIAGKVLYELEQYTNTSMPLPKLDMALIPTLLTEAVENWGLTFYKESAFLFNKSSNEPEVKDLLAMQITHEIAHQWFGSLVTPSWWSNTWLKEGMAAYLQYYIVDKVCPEWRVMDMFISREMQYILTDDDEQHYAIYKPVNSSEEIRSIYTYVIYIKAPLVLRMLRHCLSEDVFRKGLLYFLQRNKYSAVSPEDFWEALQDSLNESDIPHVQFNVQEAMESWIYQVGYPLVNVYRNYETGEVTISQEYFDSIYIKSSDDEIPYDNKWWIPISFTTRGNLNFSSTLPAFWLTPENNNETISEINADDWIIVNNQATGYYRVNYDTTNWKRIAKHLNTENYTNIHPLNRIQILNDAYHMLLSSRLDPIVFIEITKYLTRETDYAVWRTMFEILDKIFQFVRCNNNAEILKPYIWSIMDNFIRHIGFEDQTNDDYLTKVTRHNMLLTACAISHPQCLSFTHEKLVAYLANPEEHKIPKELFSWTLCNGLQTGNESIRKAALEINKKDIEELLSLIACTNNQTIIEDYLNTIIRENQILEKEQLNTIFNVISQMEPEYLDTAFNFLTRNWDKILEGKNRNHYLSLYLKVISSKSITSAQLKKYDEFLKSHNITTSVELRAKEKFVSTLEDYASKISKWLREQREISVLNVVTRKPLTVTSPIRET